MPRHPEHNKQLPPVALDKDGMYVCLICKRGHDQIGSRWYPWEIPRHLEKHSFPHEARILRMQLIPDWNKNFEKDYLANLYNKIEKEKPLQDVQTDSKSAKFKKEEKEQKQREQEAARESD